MVDLFSPLRTRLGQDREDAYRKPVGLSTTGQPLFVGQVFAVAKLPTSPGLYYAVHPVAVLGTETEGRAATLSVDLSTTAIVCVFGTQPPAAGDLLVCKFDGNRWIAERGTPPGSGPPPTVTIPGCSCVAIPATLHMSSSGGCAAGDFYPCILRYGPTPTELSGLDFGSNCFLSTEAFIDSSTNRYFRYSLSCNSVYFKLSRAYLPSESNTAYHSSTTYTWAVGLAGNSCSPFLLSNGTTYTGGNSTCMVTISA